MSAALASSLLKNRGMAQQPVGVELNPQAVAQIANELNENGILWQLVQKLIRNVFQGGITIKLRVGSRVVDLKGQTQTFINTHWVPALKEALEAAFAFGVYPIVYEPMEKSDGSYIVLPRVPINGSWSVRFLVNEHGSLDYTLYRMNLQTSASSATAQPVVWRNARVFEWMRPTIDGRINSIVQRTMRYVTTFNNSWRYYDQVTAELATPPYVTTQTSTRGGGQQVEGPTEIPLGETDVGFSEDARKRQIDDDGRRALQLARQKAAATNSAVITQHYDSESQMMRSRQIEPPWERRKLDLPAGSQLASNFPRPAVPTSFQSVINELITIISNILEIPDQIATQMGTGKFAASANLAQRQFNDLIESIQDKMKPHIQQMFYDIYGEEHSRFVENVAEVMQIENEQTFDDDELQRINDDVEVIVVFNNVPDVTFEILEKMYLRDLIPLEEFARQVFRIFNICEADSCLTEKGTFFSEKTMRDQQRAASMSSGASGTRREQQQASPGRAAGGGGGDRGSARSTTSATDRAGTGRGSAPSTRQTQPPTTRSVSVQSSAAIDEIHAAARARENGQKQVDRLADARKWMDTATRLAMKNSTVEELQQLAVHAKNNYDQTTRDSDYNASSKSASSSVVADEEQYTPIVTGSLGGYQLNYMRANGSRPTRYYDMFDVGPASQRYIDSQVVLPHMKPPKQDTEHAQQEQEAYDESDEDDDDDDEKKTEDDDDDDDDDDENEEELPTRRSKRLSDDKKNEGLAAEKVACEQSSNKKRSRQATPEPGDSSMASNDQESPKRAKNSLDAELVEHALNNDDDGLDTVDGGERATDDDNGSMNENGVDAQDSEKKSDDSPSEQSSIHDQYVDGAEPSSSSDASQAHTRVQVA